MGEVAISKLPNKGKAFWHLETFLDDDQIVHTVKILKPDLSGVFVNVNHLTSLELYFELDNPQVYSDGSNNLAQEEDNQKEGEIFLR